MRQATPGPKNAAIDQGLIIQLKTEYVQNIARETLERDCDRLELLPTFQTHDPQLESIGMMLLTEVQRSQFGSQLYLDSLVNVLAVNLLRQHATSQPHLPVYEEGLPHSYR